MSRCDEIRTWSDVKIEVIGRTYIPDTEGSEIEEKNENRVRVEKNVSLLKIFEV